MDFTTLIYIVVPLGLAYFWYARIISLRNKAREALSGIDAHLRMRFDLIPNILAIARKFMEHERGLLNEVTELRTKMQTDYNPRDREALKQHFTDSDLLDSKMRQLLVAVEAYPDLKSDQTMVQAQQSYNEVEAQIVASRRFYNASVTSLNNAVQIFPGNLIAKIAGVSEMPFYEAEAESKAPVSAAAHL